MLHLYSALPLNLNHVSHPFTGELVEALDKKLALKRKFLRYVNPLKSITSDTNQKECWIQQMKFLIKDFKILLNLPFNEFWSTVVFNKQSTIGFHTFLQEAAPPHLLDQLPQDDEVLQIYNKIEHFSYLLFKRLTTSSESKQNYMVPHYMWELLFNNDIINIPIIFDICVIYGQSCKKELEVILKELFLCQKLYNDSLKSYIQYTIKCFTQFQDKIELDLEYDNRPFQNETDKSSSTIDEGNFIMVEDIINFLLDTSYSITNFLEIYPTASTILYQEKLHLKIASFYHIIKPLIYKKIIILNKLELFQDKLQAIRLLLVKSVQQCLIHLTDQISNKKEIESVIEEYFEVITELLAYNEFVNDFNLVYNIGKDVKKCQKISKVKDSTRYDYFLKSLALIDVSNSEVEQKETQERQLEQEIVNANLENAKLQSLISDVQDLLPHLGVGFIQKCLEYYDMNSEKVISMILENSLPLELTQYSFNLPKISECDGDNATGYDASVKENKKLKKLKAVLDDKTFRNEMRPFYEKYNFTEVTCAELESYYDDEYDDTYDEVEYVIPEPVDENEKRRPDVVPRVLTEKKVINRDIKEESSDDEPQQVVNFLPFCENPEDVRERQARKYAAKRSIRSNQNKSKMSNSLTTSSGSNIDLERQRKNENKSFQGNHNRKNAARNKQQKGMF